MATRCIIGGDTPRGPLYVYCHDGGEPTWAGRALKAIIERDGPRKALDTILGKGDRGWSCLAKPAGEHPRKHCYAPGGIHARIPGYGWAYRHDGGSELCRIEQVLKEPGCIAWAYTIHHDGSITIRKLRNDLKHRAWTVAAPQSGLHQPRHGERGPS